MTVRDRDTEGNLYARLDAVKKGDTLIADGGFTCIEAGTKLIVGEAAYGLFVPCKDGEHFLAGQADDGIHLIGFYPG